MKRCLFTVLLLLSAGSVLARGMTAQEVECLSQLQDESDFIVSRINLIHSSYEKQVEDSHLAKFKSGDYSTIGLLDNTIRKYRRKLVHQIKNYPFRYEAKIQASHRAVSKRCLVKQLRDESVGTIHEFEISWEKTLKQAQRNASYFQQLDRLR
jgi:hypothetical protein